ncbi:response regulator [Breznakiella homolactica]|uniref:Response regulator n=1 Tax=Breznakiella homolactica TaxID=2798577 RepID=A0A7T7XLU8_9SPIR|nr:response regulator [Breznakiella homolactica]QQO08633.1 response regulator [Breznakiella homolactica]
MGVKKRILIADDEPHIAELLAMNCRQYGYDFTIAADGPGAVEAAGRDNPDLILLDLMLPGMSGLEVCRIIKSDPGTANIPIIMLTAKSEESDKVIGLGVGADDYLTKPFGIRELFARIEAVLRRSNGGIPVSRDKVLAAGSLTLDIEGHGVRLGSDPVNLSPTEFALLAELIKHPGKVVLRDTLIKAGGISGAADPGRSLDVHIRNLRRKICLKDGGAACIQTVRGFGFRLDNP